MTESKLSNILKAKEDMLKSQEQLEAERQEILSKRCVKLDLEGKLKPDLIEMVQRFHDILISLHIHYYDLNEKHDRQKYDMMELAERARQIEKGKSKMRKSNIVHTGLGGSVFAKVQEHFPQAPPKISLFSRYERVTDRRSLKERRDVFAAPKQEREYVPFKPKAKLKELEAPKNVKKERPRKRIETFRKEAEEELKRQQEEETAAAAAAEAMQEEEAPVEGEEGEEIGEGEETQQYDENEANGEEYTGEEPQAEEEEALVDE